MIVRYELPKNWVRYDPLAIQTALVEAKAAMIALRAMPYQRSWADELQRVQLKREVAGTSRIEGAEFTEKELDAAMLESPGALETRSQRQAAAAVATYRWIAALPADRPISVELVLDIHARLVSGCDDDHCPPGRLRRSDENVIFGTPRHRGAEGGRECEVALHGLIGAALTSNRDHDPLIQALALHYHLAAAHPFLDGNGRTARAVEALMLQRIGLRDTLFIAMSNYYYEEKTAYLQALNDTRASGHDLTPFLTFALRGIALQCRRLFGEIRVNVAKALFRNTVADLFGRLQSSRKRIMSNRQVQILNLLLDEGAMMRSAMARRTGVMYQLKNPSKAFTRDVEYLQNLGAVRETTSTDEDETLLAINLAWPTEITETEFFRKARELPRVRGILRTPAPRRSAARGVKKRRRKK